MADARQISDRDLYSPEDTREARTLRVGDRVFTYHHRQNDADRAEEPQLSLQLDFLLLVCHCFPPRTGRGTRARSTLHRSTDTVNSDSKFSDTSHGLPGSLDSGGGGGGGGLYLLWTATARLVVGAPRTIVTGSTTRLELLGGFITSLYPARVFESATGLLTDQSPPYIRSFSRTCADKGIILVTDDGLSFFGHPARKDKRFSRNRHSVGSLRDSPSDSNESKMNNAEVEFSNEDSEFYFESDHLALKGNKDYSAFLKTIVILEAQRVQAIEDLDKLMSVRAEALKDPISFVARLQNGDLPELPGPQKIAEVPYVDWSQYNIALPDVRMRPQTRHGHVLPQMQSKTEQENGKILVRGRAFDESKPETFNQLWTVEEQRRLEELLIEYPPEEVEMRRWTKIANALGNRTPKQVSSRVQKYFIKLLRAGLPIPGRGPKLKLDVKKNLSHKQRSNHFLFKRSTFFPHQDISFNLDENKEQPVAEESEDDTLNGGSDDNPMLRQINLLRQVKAEKEQDSPVYKHVGYKCTVCGEEPLKGTRWHCAECLSGIDLCGDCAVAQLEAENPSHDPSHRLIPIKPPPCTRNYDLDYFPQNFSNSSYNYLDPNFLPE